MRAAKVDRNHLEIVRALEAFGCSVQSLASAGKGVPDLLVGVNGCNVLLEVKDGRKVPSARKLTPDQQDWHNVWRGQVHVVESIQEAVEVVNHYRRTGEAPKTQQRGKQAPSRASSRAIRDAGKGAA